MLGSKLLAATLRLCLALLLTAIIQPAAVTAHAADPASMESQLLTLLNQDRAGAGLPPLRLNATMSAIARDARISVCPGQTVHGRARDMVERNYFAHQIPPCRALVNPAVEAAGISMQSGAETIGFNNNPPALAAAKVNQDWLTSAPHRAAIMANFRQVGIGAWSASGSWTGAGRPVSGVIVFSAIFTGSGAAGALPQQAAAAGSSPSLKSGTSTVPDTPQAQTRTESLSPEAQPAIVTNSVARAADAGGRPASALSLVISGVLPTSGFVVGAACGFLGCLAVRWRRRRMRV
ncbi:MAG: CAP domain-containing protein [Candidatus Dormibacteraeota bacterium]|nr:CAP domain-containing protein [Candidatus Dormibacteraeota bacterium]